MTPHEIASIRSTWTLLEATTDAVASKFYDRLFLMAPEAQAFFAHTDMAAQQEKLSHTLGLVVRSLDDLARLHPAIRSLGIRHAQLGVQSAHFDVVGRALRSTFAEILGESYTDEADAAWQVAYDALANAMQQSVAVTDG